MKNYFKCKRIIDAKCWQVVNYWVGCQGIGLRSSTQASSIKLIILSLFGWLQVYRGLFHNYIHNLHYSYMSLNIKHRQKILWRWWSKRHQESAFSPRLGWQNLSNFFGTIEIIEGLQHPGESLESKFCLILASSSAATTHYRSLPLWQAAINMILEQLVRILWEWGSQ